MLRLKDLKISTKVTLLVVTAAVGLMAFSLITYRTITTVEVTGDLYNQISLYKALDSESDVRCGWEI